MNRRGFLKSLSAFSLAMIPTINEMPIRKLFPLLIPAEEILPGTPYWYTSTCRECPVGCGVMLKVRNGNVIKIEGNPNHPINQGGLCPRGQAALQELYNVDRLKLPLRNPEFGAIQEINWKTALSEIRHNIVGGNTVFLTGQLTGSQKNFIQKWLKSLNQETKLVIHEPAIRLSQIYANENVFNSKVPNVYHMDRADFILSFGADFLETWCSPMEMTRQFSNTRRFLEGKSAKFIYVGISDSLTAMNADEEYKIRPTTEAVVIFAIARWVLENKTDIKLRVNEKNEWVKSLSPFTTTVASQVSGLPEETIVHLASQFIQFENSLVLCGEPLAAHKRGTDSYIAVNILNYILGNWGNTLTLGENNDEIRSNSISDFQELVLAMEADEISNLLIFNTNPSYTYPDSQRFETALKKVPLKIAFVTSMNETAANADYIIPVHHWIESWGIESPRKNVYSLLQPVITPVFNTLQMEEVLSRVSTSIKLPINLPDFIKSEWEQIYRDFASHDSFEDNWKKTLITGGIWNEKRNVPLMRGISPNVHKFLRDYKIPEVNNSNLTLAVNFSQRFFDGRGANKPWLWELPDSMYQSVWDIPVRIHPELAAKQSLKEGDIVQLKTYGKSIEAPVLLTPYVHPSVLAMELGAGHTQYGRFAVNETGNPFTLIPIENETGSGDYLLQADNVELNKTGKSRELVRVQGGYDQGERKILQKIPLSEAMAFQKQGAKREEPHSAQIYPVHEHQLYDWTMVIDLSACIGCGACVVACYAENSVPVVGKDQCKKGREMSWIRIERFNVDNRHGFIPIMCQHCEAAPCETVCPVYATVHSNEGLNVQVYNRCVGTRYCSNNCPYKARRFNYFPAKWPEPMNRLLNPDIYHRPKGVMEKCTFCVQRIRLAKEDAKMEGRTIRDGEVIPACAQSCPTQAITFGNLKDPDSRVSQLIDDFRGYYVFENLNTQPSVVYLKGIKHE